MHIVRAGVVGGERERQIVVVKLKKVVQVMRSGVNVFLRIENVLHAQAGGGFREQLHQPARVLGGNGFRIKVGFHFHHAADEFFGAVDGLQNDLQVHGRLARLAGALAINSVLANQDQGISKQVKADRQASAGHAHHEFVFL